MGVPINRVIQGDALQVLATFPSESVDLVATDPPYGLEFMGKDWDKAVPNVGIWKECLRVLKSGAFAFILCTPRQDCLSHMIVNLESAGFDCGFTSIYWTYASGFPKAMNISKAVDKRAGRLSQSIGQLKSSLRDKFEASGLTLKQFNEMCGFEASGYLRRSSTWASVFPTAEKWAKMKTVLTCDDTLDSVFREAEREILAPKDWTSSVHHIQVGADHSERVQLNDTIPASDQAKVLDGSYGGFQPKPAVEIIIVAMKPLGERTYVDQALKNQKGVTWLDDARIPFQNEVDKEGLRTGFTHFGLRHYSQAHGYDRITKNGRDEHLENISEKGRFPANLLVSDDALNDGKERISAWGKDTAKEKPWMGNKGFGGQPRDPKFEGDSGSFSRFFDLDAWFEKQLEKLPKSVRRTFPFLIVAKSSKSEREQGLEASAKQPLFGKYEDASKMGWTGADSPNRAGHINERANFHPTVKPLQLMSYLVTLGSREGDVILDPFVGSGTTCIAAHILNRKWVGIEIDPEYAKLAEARLKPYTTQRKIA